MCKSFLNDYNHYNYYMYTIIFTFILREYRLQFKIVTEIWKQILRYLLISLLSFWNEE